MSAISRSAWAQLDSNAPDPLDGTIAQFQAGRRLGKWTSEEVTSQALERSKAASTRWRAIDVLSLTALEEARASDQRGRNGALLGPLDGVPLFAKSIYDMKGLPTTGSNAEWARLFPAPVRRDALEVVRLRAAGAVVVGKTAADDFAFHGNGTSSQRPKQWPSGIAPLPTSRLPAPSSIRSMHWSRQPAIRTSSPPLPRNGATSR